MRGKLESRRGKKKNEEQRRVDRTHNWWSNEDKRYYNNNHHRARDSTTYFFTNFPDMWTVAMFEKLFMKFGTICDVYIIAKKLNKQGYRFGFVRFLNMKDVKDMEDNLNGLPVGQIKLFVNIAKFEKKKSHSTHQQENVEKDQSHRPAPNVPQWNPPLQSGKSFADAVNGTKPVYIDLEILTTTIKWLQCCLIGKATTYESLNNLENLRDAEGCSDINLSYLGGLEVLLDFETVELASHYKKQGYLPTHGYQHM